MSLMQNGWRHSLAGLALLSISSVALANQDDDGDRKKSDSPENAFQEREEGEKAKPRERSSARKETNKGQERERSETRERRREQTLRDDRRGGDAEDPRRREVRERREVRVHKDDRDHDSHEDEREGTERRLAQMLSAAEKLQDAGFREDANNLRKLADELREHFLRRDAGLEEREHRERERRMHSDSNSHFPSEFQRDRDQRSDSVPRFPSGAQRPAPPRPPARPRLDPRRPANPSEGSSDAVLDLLQDMRKELSGLREEMNDLRNKVDSRSGAGRGSAEGRGLERRDQSLRY